jgi:hypothetical protein
LKNKGHRLPHGRGSVTGHLIPSRDRKGVGAFGFSQTRKRPVIFRTHGHSVNGGARYLTTNARSVGGAGPVGVPDPEGIPMLVPEEPFK